MAEREGLFGRPLRRAPSPLKGAAHSLRSLRVLSRLFEACFEQSLKSNPRELVHTSTTSELETGHKGPFLVLAEREGFEPSVRFRTHTFQACSFDRSDTSPCTALATWLQTAEMSGNPNQPHPGTRVRCYRCSLPGLAGFTTCRCEGTGKGRHRRTGSRSSRPGAHISRSLTPSIAAPTH